jgi:hypothetical protein
MVTRKQNIILEKWSFKKNTSDDENGNIERTHITQMVTHKEMQ